MPNTVDDCDSEIEFVTRCKSSFRFFAESEMLDQEYYEHTGDSDGLIVTDFHQEWVDAVEDNDRIAITAFTGSGKTTILGVIYPIWKVLFEEADILIVSSTMSQSTKILDEIKHHIENSEWLQDLKPDSREATWKQTEIELSNGCNIYCKPFNKGVKGVHVDYALCDEAAEFKEHDVYERYVKTRVARKNGTICLISTPVHENDLMAKLSEGHETKKCPECGRATENEIKEGEETSICVNPDCDRYDDVVEPDFDPNISERGYWNGKFPVEDENSDPTFSQAFDEDDIQQLRNEKPEAFQREYLCESLAVEGDLFDPNDIMECYDKERSFEQKIDEDAVYYMGCDFAVSKKGDYSVFTVIEDYPEDEGYTIKYMERIRGLKLSEQERRIEELHEIFDFRDIIVDETNFGQRTLQNLRDMGLPVTGQSFERKARNNLIITLKTMLEKGDITIPRGRRGETTRKITDTLYNELLGFGTSVTEAGSVTYQSSAKHDDTVMSLAMAVSDIDEQREVQTHIAF